MLFFIGTTDYISTDCFLDAIIGIPLLLVLLFVIVETVFIRKYLTESVIVHSSHSVHDMNTEWEGMAMRYSHYISKGYKTMEWILMTLCDVC